MVHPQQAGRVGRLQDAGDAVRTGPLPAPAVDRRNAVEPLLIFPDPAPPALAQALDLAGYPWKAASGADSASRIEPEDGWAGAIGGAEPDPDSAFSLCRTIRKRDVPLEPLLLLVSIVQ